jgi:hypothetical protein
VRSRLLIVSLLVCLAAASCRGGGHGSAADTLPPAVGSTTTTAVSYAVPPVIDQAYVAKVMAALDHVYGEAVRHLAQTRQIDAQFLKYLVAIYTPHQFDLAEESWAKDAANGFPGLLATPGDPVTLVQRVLQADRNCVLASVTRTFQPTRSQPVNITPQRYVGLIPAPPNRDLDDLNPTPWAMAFDGFIADPAGAVPETPCDAR